MKKPVKGLAPGWMITSTPLFDGIFNLDPRDDGDPSGIASRGEQGHPRN